MTDYLMETLMVNKTLLLDELAKQITEHSREADEPLLKGALLLRDARAQFEEGEDGVAKWTQWAEQNLDIRESRLRQLLRIAKAEDPERELGRQRQQTKERVARHREKKRKEAALRSAALMVASDPGKATETPESRQVESEQPQPDQRRKTELERTLLIEWAHDAPIDHVRETWRFASKLAGRDSDRTPPSATKPAAISAQEAATPPAVH